MKPIDAIRAAKIELSDKGRFTLDEVVQMAKKKLGRSLAAYKDELVTIALRKKATDLLGKSASQIQNENVAQGDFFASIMDAPVSVKDEDGEKVYMQLGHLRREQLEQIQEERLARRKHEKADQLLEFIAKVLLILEKRPGLSASEAAKYI